MSTIKISDFGEIISDELQGDKILISLKKLLESTNEKIEVNFDGVSGMTTFCAKQIFGHLYVTIGSETFHKRLLLLNISDNLQTILHWGISNAIEETETA